MLNLVTTSRILQQDKHFYRTRFKTGVHTSRTTNTRVVGYVGKSHKAFPRGSRRAFPFSLLE